MTMHILSSIMREIIKIKYSVMKKGLRLRLSLFIMLVSLLPILALGFFSYYKSSSTIKNITSNYMNDIVNEVNSNLQLRFKNINEIGKVLLNSNTVRDILSRDDAEAVKYYEEDYSKMAMLLNMISDSNENIKSAYILASRNMDIFPVGDITEAHGLDYLNEEFRKNYKVSPIYTSTMESGENYKWWPTQSVLGKNVFTLTEKLKDGENDILGVLVIHIGVEIVDDIYNKITTSSKSVLILMDNDGRILFHPDKSFIGKKMFYKDIQDRVLKNEEGDFIITEDGRSLFVVYNTFPAMNWKSIVITEYDELISEASKISNATLIISFTCIVFIILFSIFISQSIFKPVYHLNQLMKVGSTGDMKVRFNVLYNDEIGQLGDSFNKMMGEIQNLIKMVEEESKKKAEAEIKVLEAHINPHFLYNTLASIYWSAMAKGDTEIGKMAASLSKFFRLGLNKGKEFTTIEKEVEHVREYMSIQCMLYKSAFSYETFVDPQILSYKTIKLILQPLVENSFVHGMGKKKEKGLIKVDVFERDNRVVFRVTDNGSGINDLKEHGLEYIIQNGYGLKNIRERLKLYFDNDFTISCTSIPNTETVFEITIPAMLQEGVDEDV